MRHGHILFYGSLVLMFTVRAFSQTTVVLSSDETLLPFFKAGLHPKSKRGLEEVYCKLPNQTTLTLDFGKIKLPAITADWQIGVQHDDRLITMTAYVNRLLSIAEAKEMAEALNRSFGLPFGEVTKALDGTNITGEFAPRYHPKVEIPVPGCVIEVGYNFNASMVREKPLLLLLSVEWHRSRKEVGARTSPIKPPPGYEHISMAPDPNDPGMTSLTPQIHAIMAEREAKKEIKSDTTRESLRSARMLYGIILSLLILLGYTYYRLRRRGAH